jgi:transcriptional antiterminator NusG
MSDKLRDTQEDDLSEEISFEGNQDIESAEEQPVETAKTKTAEQPSQVQVGAPKPTPVSEKPASDSKFFAIRTTGGQERMVADMLYTKVTAKKIGIRSVMVLESFKGYIIVEAPDSNVAYEGLAGIRHVRGQIRGDLPFKDIEGYLVKKPTVTELSIDDTVEVIAGPFKGMKAKITRVDYEKQEATVVLLDSPYQIPVTVDANYLKKVAH